MSTFLIICIAILLLVNLVLLFKLFGRKVEGGTVTPPVTPKETKAIATATTAFVKRAEVQATTAEKKAELAAILKIEDPAEQLTRLAEKFNGKDF